MASLDKAIKILGVEKDLLKAMTKDELANLKKMSNKKMAFTMLGDALKKAKKVVKAEAIEEALKSAGF